MTGGTRGIGLAIACRLARQGFAVTATYAHDPTAAESAVAAARAQGLSLSAVRCDAASRADWQALFARGTPLYEGVSVLVHAAGFTRDRLLLTMSEEDFDAVVDVHLKGAFLAAQAALRPMIAARAGRLIFLTSPTAALGRPGQTNYGAAKAGLEGLMRSLVHEVSRFGITVNCVRAGLVETALLGDVAQDVKQKLLAGVPLGRMGTAEEIAAGVAFLASEQASYITGQVLAVDGGLTV